MADMQAVKSSTISHVGYDEPTQTLTVRFTHGGTYKYAGVPKEKHEALIASPSIGRHFHDYIRNQHAATRV